MTGIPALRLALPGQWHALPLGSDDEVAAQVAAFVREHFGRRDDQATQRAEQRARLGEAARRARDAGAVQFHLSLRGPAAVVLASSAAEFHPRLPLGAHAAPAAVADALVRVLAGGGAGGGQGSRDGRTAGAGDHWERFAADGGAVFDRGDGLVLRTTRRTEPADPERDAATAVADYWLTVPGRADAVLLTFTTALAALEPLMTELFDAIVAASEWTPHAAAERGASDSDSRLRDELRAGRDA
jgi:hypothetical protein